MQRKIKRKSKIYVTNVVFIIVFLLAISIENGLADEYKVKGMICSFCAQGIEKKFKQDPRIQKVTVDLDRKKIILEFQEGQKLTKDEVREKLEQSGYQLVEE
ncbi:MAG: heavy-metal-associated domain-containing protein [Bdellovibrionaceae bacterium]|nr:heavy-metal-associated domain-containing protein [Pseudobdellovibrionaceae bacterium]MDW8190964.1 heavy metal-associated domain-containing protein [Pseudobdellovibrionaceae bacterium]